MPENPMERGARLVTVRGSQEFAYLIAPNPHHNHVANTAFGKVFAKVYIIDCTVSINNLKVSMSP